ncbi:MAG: PulJ/GspJ family protein [Opitutales bacterium]
MQLPTKSPAGFTLLEVLLAISITGFVLAAASTMVFSVSNIWMNRQESHFFEDHVDGVTEFIQSCFTNAGTEIALEGSDATADADANPDQPEDTPENGEEQNNGNNSNNAQAGKEGTGGGSSGQSLLRRTENPIGWAKPPGFATYRDPLVNFKLRDNPPLFVNTDNAPVMGIDAFLYFEKNEGLSLLWYSILQEEAEDEDDLRRTLVSPYIQAIRYVYWDERFERWEEEEEPQEEENDEYLLPRYLKLIFEYEGETMERTVSIPVPSTSALLF